MGFESVLYKIVMMCLQIVFQFPIYLLVPNSLANDVIVNCKIIIYFYTLLHLLNTYILMRQNRYKVRNRLQASMMIGKWGG